MLDDPNVEYGRFVVAIRSFRAAKVGRDLRAVKGADLEKAFLRHDFHGEREGPTCKSLPR